LYRIAQTKRLRHPRFEESEHPIVLGHSRFAFPNSLLLSV
jgi:hypothetical protein